MTSTQTGHKAFHIMAKAVGSACNMRCDYCYYLEKGDLLQGFKPSGQHSPTSLMQGEVLERFISSYLASHEEGGTVAFTWHGGEALLRPKAFYEEAIRLQELYRGSRQVENTLQTNGLLMSEAWCHFFREHNFLIGISLDGNERQHNAYRRTIGGQGTFHRVMRAVEMMQRLGVEFNILSTINSQNADEPLEYYRFLKGIGAKYIQFSPIVERISNTSKRYQHVEAPYIDLKEGLRRMHDGLDVRLAPYSIHPSQWGEFLCSVFEEWVHQDVGEIFVQMFDATLAGWMGVMPGVCTLAPECGHAGIIEADGSVFSCDHYVYPRYRLGNVLEQDIFDMMNSPEQRRFGQAKREGLTEQCRACKYRFACHGECPKNRFATSHSGERGHNYLCAGYYEFFDYVAPYMDYMRRCLLLGQAPSMIMERLAQGKSLI